MGDFKLYKTAKNIRIEGQSIKVACNFPSGKPKLALTLPPGFDQKTIELLGLEGKVTISSDKHGTYVYIDDFRHEQLKSNLQKISSLPDSTEVSEHAKDFLALL